MSRKKEYYTFPVHFTEEEKELLERKFSFSGFRSKKRFIKKMILEGMVLQFDEEKEKNLLLCVNRVSANINQIARRVNSSGNIYEEDIRSVQEGVDELRQQVKSFLFLLQKLKP